MIKHLFFTSALATLAASVYIVKDECGPNEEYQLCGSACPVNCTDTTEPDPIACNEDCIEGCFCKAGFLRDDNGTCVTPDQCFGSQSICSENEEFLSCGTACPLTCGKPDSPAACGLACSMGCFCKGGYVRDEDSGNCVTVDKCPREQCLTANEVYDICNAACEPTCQDPEPICVKVCTGGCVCAPGLLRDDNGVCVSVDKCPAINGTDPGLLGKYLNMINKILYLSSS